MRIPKLPPVLAVRVSDDRTLLTVTYLDPIPERTADDGLDIIARPVFDWFIGLVIMGVVAWLALAATGIVLTAVASDLRFLGIFLSALAMAILAVAVVGYLHLPKPAPDAVPTD